MRILRYTDPGFEKAVAQLNRKAAPDPAVEKTVREILEGVRAGGDRALLEYCERFGGPRLKGGKRLRVTGSPEVDPATAAAIRESHANVHAFAKRTWQENGRRQRSRATAPFLRRPNPKPLHLSAGGHAPEVLAPPLISLTCTICRLGYLRGRSAVSRHRRASPR